MKLILAICMSAIILPDIIYKPIYVVTNKVQTINLSKDVLDKSKSINFNEVLGHSLDITTDSLSFKLKSPGNMSTPKLVETKEANCVGYVTYYNSVLKALIKDNGFKNVKITHVRAQVFIWDINLTEILDDPSFKNHDVSIIYYDNKTYVVDPSLSDFFLTKIIKQI